PAMWGNAFNTDDPLNPELADEYGIVMGTSHHEPMLRAQQEWKKFGKGTWDYTKNDTVLREFWQKGIENMKSHESIVTVGMRGDGDEPMSRETATALLERIVKDQREILTNVTGKPASETPQLWALYKEVQDYYDKGMRVPDDVTLLLCDDNWGNLRKLPRPEEKPRKGGYGIYYHFDYVGGPRNYKWVNTNPIPRVWEQMHLAYQHKVKDIWIVNVGDIKPMEFPISFFLDYAWNPEKIGPSDLQKYTEKWSAAQFGNQFAKDIADIISKYTKYNGRRKPEMLDANTYSQESYYNEFAQVVEDYNLIYKKAEKINALLPVEYKDAFYQLVLHPVKACANLNEMYYYTALNKQAYESKSEIDAYTLNKYANRVKDLYKKDSLITIEYHRINKGKWNHMMSQTHIGYTYWQQPPSNKLPKLFLNDRKDTVIYTPPFGIYNPETSENLLPKKDKRNLFYEEEGYISIESSHFTKATNSNNITWKILPDHGRTGSAITTFPVTAKEQKPGSNSPHVEYEFYSYSKGEFSINAYFSPTLNFHNTINGLQYAISVDDEAPQIISINKDNKATEGGINY
ncbi:MAG: glycosyl hydrolase 115 family protein, partial [Chitinophagaceae bacterium]